MRKNITLYSKVLLLLLPLGTSSLAYSEYKTAKKHAAHYAVSATIVGKVVSDDGTALEGVSIQVKGTTLGTTSAADGSFSITTEEQKPVLLFSLVGYLPKQIQATAKAGFQVTLEKDVKALDNVVVVGYGQQRRKDVIGSVSQIAGNQVNKRQVTELSQALAGQVSGVTVIQRSGRPGASAGDINIRGVGSFGSSTNPLLLIDGIPGSSFNDIDPNDVESISVLKDASSAAIYGARAANGVILVTTKAGKQGKTKVTYNSYVGFQKPTAFPEFVSSAEYAQLFNEASGSVVYTPEDIQKFKDGTDPDNHPNTDFLHAVFSKKGVQTGHNVTISSGSSLGQYSLSLGYLFQDGLVIKNNYSRYNIRLNLVSNISQKLKLTTRLAAINSTRNEPAEPATLGGDLLSIISDAVRYPSIYAGQLSTGYWGLGVVQKGTPISFLQSESFYKNKNQNLNANLRLDWDAVPGLKLSAIAAYEQINGNEKNFLAEQTLSPTLTLGPNQLSISTNANYYKTLQALADYSIKWKAHSFALLGGFSYEDNRGENLAASRDKLPGNDLTELNVGAQDNQKNSGTASEWALQSLFGRFKYNYNNKYLLEATLRYDGSSRFPTSKKYGTFPSVAVGWQVAEEDFVKENLPWLKQFKLKASYGTLGNQNALLSGGGQNYYPYQNVLNPGINYSFGGSVASGVALTQLVDPTLHWESTRTADVGLEWGIFRDKLTISANYFDRYTYDILYTPTSSVSTVLGFDLSQRNTGEVKNKGWEFVISHRNNIGSFSYNVDANFTITKNQVFDLGVGDIKQPNGLVGNGSSLFINYPMNLYYGYVADGLFTNQADISKWANMTSINPSAKPGDIKYKDISGPNGVPDGKVDATYDRVVLGSQIPKYTFGINLGGKLKGFDISVLLQGVAKVNGYLDSYAGYAFNNFGTVQKWQMDERWTADNPRADAKYPRLELISNSGTPNTLTSSFWLLDASYVRLRNLQFGYSLSNRLSKRACIENLRIYVSGENLYTWSKYRKGWDPEINSSGGYYPILANYSFGVNVTF